MKKIIKTCCDFWQNNEQKVLFVLAIFLVAAASFQAGKISQETIKPPEIKLSVNNQGPTNPAEEKAKVLGEAIQRKNIETESKDAGLTGEENCALIGSKNSDKYHKPTCSWATKIKADNRVCFSSEEEAKKKGYVPAGCCHR